jgi:hypothetical protein
LAGLFLVPDDRDGGRYDRSRTGSRPGEPRRLRRVGQAILVPAERIGPLAPARPQAAMEFRFKVSGIFVALALLSACDFPRDAEGTLDRIRASGVVRVGVSERPPWVRVLDGRPAGIEPRLVEAWASSVGARPFWVEGSESSLVAALKARQIDVLIAGLTNTSPWRKDAAPSRPYHHARLVVATPEGAPAPRDKDALRGEVIAYRPSRADIAARIAEIDARPEPVQDLRGRVAAVVEVEAKGLGLAPTGIVLAKHRHIILAAPGENALLFSLDRFLAHHAATIIAEDAP